MKRNLKKVGNKIAIIGGGASGLVAAITASHADAYTVILEKNDRIGKKILSTGNGRCNFTNVNAKVSDYNSDFVSCAINEFPPEKVIDFFKGLGVLPKIEDEGRVYPMSCQASSILDVLRYEIERLGINTRTDFCVKKIEKIESGFYIYSDKNERIFSDKVIVSTGGCAAPKSGSSGDGYSLLKKLGHTITDTKPALCQLATDKGIHGVRQYAKVTLAGKYTQTGEVQFNKDNISGIPVFNLSGYANIGDKISIDFLPEYSYDDAKKMITSRPAQALETFLIGILNKNLALALLKDIGVSPLSRMSDTLSSKEIDIIVDGLKAWKMTVTGLMPWENAQVTKGGIDLSNVNPQTMQSNITDGLYITGELMDIDAPCGGYNLQWAWSSGFVAGREASKCIE